MAKKSNAGAVLCSILQHSMDAVTVLNQEQERSLSRIPEELRLNIRNGDAGVFFGKRKPDKPWRYVGMPQGTEGNIMVIGGNGSGKSSGIAKPTLETWTGAICATDIKGELSEEYERLFKNGQAMRPYIIFDPTQTDGPSYDPLWWLLKDDEENLVSNIWEIAQTIIPTQPDDKQPFWIETAQGVLAAALLYYFQLELGFSQIICKIIEHPLSLLCKEFSQSDDIRVRQFLGEMGSMSEETLASLDRELRNKLMLFATDPYISHAFRGVREGAECFNWDHLHTHNIFLRIPAYRVEQWSGAINLMYSQLIRFLERRPEKYSIEGRNTIHTLLLMDEFARFGKLEVISTAMSTLRSKNVNICLVVQSVAQLDSIYGEKERRVIFDNCQYQAILRANDPETQRYLSDLIGTHIRLQCSVSEQLDVYGDVVGYGRQISETTDRIIHPHELSTLEEILLLTPYGYCKVKKGRPYLERAVSAGTSVFYQNTSIMNKESCMMDINKRLKSANECIEAAKHRQKTALRQESEKRKKQGQRRNFIVGELVTKYFPEIRDFEPGRTKEETAANFASLEAFLATLANKTDVIKHIKEESMRGASQNGYFAPTGPECVSGPAEEKDGTEGRLLS